jgi:ribosomal protein S18 acetylase RimI-like enzyme
VGIKSDLVNSWLSYFIALLNEEPAGFMKLHLNSNLPGYPSVNGMEVDKIYFRLTFKVRGIGKQLMAVALQEAIRMLKETIWLVVIDTNINAIKFYRR